MPPSYARGASFDLPSRDVVSLISWFGLLFGVLHVLGGRVLGAVEVLASVAGVYATWGSVHSRARYVAAFAACWGAQCVLEAVYFLLLLAALSAGATDFVIGVLSSSTFENLASPLRRFFATLADDVDGFVVFAALTSCVFAALAVVYGVALWREIAATAALPERAPLLPLAPGRRPTAERPPPANVRRPGTGIQGLGSLGSTERPLPPLPKVRPFEGKGDRLGAE
jgi:hypothetical protein